MGFLSKSYLCAYNLVQVAGWSLILCIALSHYTISTSESTLWDKVYYPLLIFQNAAILEVIHTMLGLVRASVIVTMMQVASRVGMCAVLLSIPTSLITSAIGLPMIILAWSITEIIRYSYYFANLIGYIPFFLTWLRYTLFIVLYPIGVTGELLLYYTTITYVSSHPEVWTYSLPNEWNFTFNYTYFLIVCVSIYIPGFPHLYLHMFSQRKKMLGSEAKTKKGQ